MLDEQIRVPVLQVLLVLLLLIGPAISFDQSPFSYKGRILYLEDAMRTGFTSRQSQCLS